MTTATAEELARKSVEQNLEEEKVRNATRVWKLILGTGVGVSALGLVASPVLAWLLAGAILTSFGVTAGWLATAFAAFLVWVPMAGLISAIGSFVGNLYKEIAS